MKIYPIEDIIEDIRAGKMVIITDDEDRENEGDLIFAADFVDSEKINFMTKYGRGLICVPLTDERLQELKLKDMAEDNKDSYSTAFTVSVDAAAGITTGISAADRARTVEVLSNDKYGASDVVSPGHLFPLRAKKGGVLTRAGHTEASVDLARLAGCTPAGVICEIMNEDGSMARMDDLQEFSSKHDIKISTVAKLIEYRRKHDRMIEKLSEAKLPTRFGEWKIMAYDAFSDNKEHIALVKGEISSDEPVLVRVHSECFTGDVLSSVRCDCQAQLNAAMDMINQEGKGIILYLRQEGRGIGLINKLKAYELQDKGFDTVEANEELGFKPDLRNYGIGAQILSDMGVSKIKLMTNNPRKVIGLEGFGLDVVERVPIQIECNEHNEFYLKTKKDKMGHFLSF